MRCLLSTFILLLAVAGLAQENFRRVTDTALFRKNLQKMAGTTVSLQSDFEQVKSLSMITNKITSKGQLWYTRPGQLRWEYTTPFPYVIVINKDKFIVKDGNKRAARYDTRTNAVFKEINDIMLSCVNGDVLDNGKFSYTVFESSSAFRLDLIPLNAGVRRTLSKIVLYFDKKMSAVEQVEMIEPNNDFTRLKFTNKKINVAVDPSRYILK